MDLLQAWVEKGTDFLMSFLLIVILVGTGIYYTNPSPIYTDTAVRTGLPSVFGNFSLKGEKHEKGEMTPFQSPGYGYRGPGMAQEIWPERPRPSSAAAQGLFSGCGSALSLAWLPSILRRFLLKSTRPRWTDKLQAARCTISRRPLRGGSAGF